MKKGTNMTDLEIKKARLKAIRLAAGVTDDMVKLDFKGVQAPDGVNESDYRFRKFGRHHRLVA
jgi:hypothetical protein